MHKVVAFIALLTFAGNAHGEAIVMAHAGMSRSTMTNITPGRGETVNPRIAPLFGASIEPMGFHALFGATITNKGIDATVRGDAILGNFSGGIRARYVELSGLGKIPIHEDNNTIAYILGGGFAGIEVGCNVRARIRGVSADVDCDHPDLNVSITGTSRFALVGGLGVSKKVGNAWLSWDVTYSHDTNPILLDGEETNHRTLSSKVGIGFPLALSARGKR